ncbi:MAG: hypothetical protein ACYYKD_04555 [Rhodospirillales bacterium]
MNRADSAPADFSADAADHGAFDDADVGELAPAAVGFTPSAQKGRGAVGNPAGRYEPETRHAADDGWGVNPADESAPLPHCGDRRISAPRAQLQSVARHRL